MNATALTDSDNPDILTDWDVRDYPEDSPVRQSVMETSRLAAIVKRLSFTGLLGAGLIASGFQPEQSIGVVALGAVLLIPTALAIQSWCAQRRIPKKPEPLVDVLKTAVRRIPKRLDFSLTIVGVTAIACTMLAVNMAEPDYDYPYLQNSTSMTRLGDSNASNKSFDGRIPPLSSAAITIESLESATRFDNKERVKALKKASADYLRTTIQKQGSPEYKRLFVTYEEEIVRKTPYLREILPRSMKDQYTMQAIANIEYAARKTSRDVSIEEKRQYIHSLRQVCAFGDPARSAEIQKKIDDSWKIMITKQLVEKSGSTRSYSPFQNGIHNAITADCDKETFSP